jgi:hypothetical protein
MPLGNFLKDAWNALKGVILGKNKARPYFDKLKANPADDAALQAIKEMFADAKQVKHVIAEVLRRIDITTQKKQTDQTGLMNIFRRTWENTIHRERVQPLQYVQPTARQQLIDYVKQAEKDGLLLRAVGAGHSFSDVANATDMLVDMLGLNAVLDIESDTLRPTTQPLFRCEAGMMVEKLNRELDKLGLAIHTMAAFDQETIYGAIATSTHGTGIRVDGMPKMVRSMDIIAAGGQCYRLEPGSNKGITDPAKFKAKYPNNEIILIQDDDKFHSAVVGFGLMGIVYAIVIEPVKTYYLRQRLWVTDWDTVKQKLADRSFFTAINDKWAQIEKDPVTGQYPPTRAQVFVNPYLTKNFITKALTHTCVVQIQTEISKAEYDKLNQEVKANKQPKILSFIEEILSNGATGVHEVTVKAEDKNSAVESLSTDGLLILLNDFPFLTPLFLDISMIVLLSGSGKFGKSYEVMNQGKLAIKDAGYSVEPGLAVDDSNMFIRGAEEIMRVAAVSQASHSYLTSPMCMRYVKASEDYMSPEYATDTCMIDVPLMLGTIGDNQMLDRMQLDLLALGARPHWGKICNLVNGEALIRTMYPKFDAFLQTVAFFNPHGTFNSRFSYRTGMSKMKYQRP